MLFCVECMEHAHIYIYVYIKRARTDLIMYTLDATGAYWRCILIVRIFRIMGLDSNIGSAGFDSCKQQPNSIYRCTNLLYIFQYIYIYA